MVIVGMSGVGLAGVVGEPVFELEPVRGVDREHAPPAVGLVPLGAGHEVGDVAAGGEIVVDERRRVRRRAPPPLELARVLPQLPHRSTGASNSAVMVMVSAVGVLAGRS